MRLRHAVSLSLAVGAMALCSAALAQDPATNNPNPGANRQARRAGRQANVDLGTVPVALLDSIVTLTAEQKTKLTAIQEKYQADTRALRPQRGAPVDPAARQKRTELRQQTNKDIMALLTDEQKAKLRTATPFFNALRMAGVPMGVLPELKLTKEQRTQIETIAKDAQEKIRALPRTTTPQERREQMKPIQDDVKAKVTALLTADQKAAIAKFRPQGRRQPGAGR